MLYIPFENYQGQVGGPSTFMHYLQHFLLAKHIELASDVDDPRIKTIFFPIAYDLERLKQWKSQGCRIIQRLDGIYYPSKHGEKYIELNQDIKTIYCDLADHVVFQSEYSRSQCSAQFGPHKSYSIITNGVNNDLFLTNQNLDFDKTGVVNFITTGNFRNRDMLEPLVEALDSLFEQGIKLNLLIVGPIAPFLNEYLERPYVTRVGKQSLIQVAKHLQKAHIFLYSHLNPPCPNSVLEAIAVGLPVVGFDSGSMAELLFWQKDLLAPVSIEVFQEYKDFKPHLLSEKIIKCVDNWNVYKQRALMYTQHYTFAHCGEQYLHLFTQIT